MIFTAVTAAGLGLWKAVSYRHPAHAYPLYEEADFTSGHRISVGPNVVSVRSVARNRYDGSIDILRSPGLNTSIPHADVLKQCCTWLDVVQIELEPGPELLAIADVKVFHHDTRTPLQENEGLDCRLFSPNVIHVYGLGKEVPEQFDLWIQGRSYPSDEVVILTPEKGSKADIAGGTIEIVDLAKDFPGWNEDVEFLVEGRKYTTDQCAITLDWQGDWPGDDWREVNVVTKDGVTRFSYNNFSFRFPAYQHRPLRFHIPWDEIDHFEIRPETKDRAFFFDGLMTLPLNGRKFDVPPSVTRTVDQLLAGTKLTEYAPLDIKARIYQGDDVWPDYNVLLGVRHHPSMNQSGNQDDAFTTCVWESGNIYLPFDFHWKDAKSKMWQSRNLQHGNANIEWTDSGVCRVQVFRESLDEMDSAKIVLGSP